MGSAKATYKDAKEALKEAVKSARQTFTNTYNANKGTTQQPQQQTQQKPQQAQQQTQQPAGYEQKTWNGKGNYTDPSVDFDANFERAVVATQKQRIHILKDQINGLDLANPDPQVREENYQKAIDYFNSMDFENGVFGEDGLAEIVENPRKKDTTILYDKVKESHDSGKHAEQTLKEAKQSTNLYDNYDINTNTAQIKFAPPINEISDASKSAVGYTKDGTKQYFGEVQTTPVAGANVQISKNGSIDFSSPANKHLLSQPHVLAKIVEQYPDSFGSIPPVVFASDARLLATAYKKGIIDNEPISKDANYFMSAETTLSEMSTKAKTTAKKQEQDQIDKVANNINFDQEIERSM